MKSAECRGCREIVVYSGKNRPRVWCTACLDSAGTKSCAWCGDEFALRSLVGPGFTYCPSHAADRQRTGPRPTHPCELCGEPTALFRRWCSKECCSRWVVPWEVTCAECGDEFTTSQSAARFCSPRCKRAAKVRRRRDDPANLVACECGCGQTFGVAFKHKGRRRFAEGCPTIHGPQAPGYFDRPCQDCGEIMPSAHVSRKRCEVCARQDLIGKVMGLYRTAYETGQVKQACMWRHTLVDVLVERDGTDCALCGDPMNIGTPTGPRGDDDEGVTIDHVHPRSLGGGDELENLQLAHWACNRAKGNDPDWVAT